MWGTGRDLWRSDGGAVAPTVALSLVALLAVGGIAFDYAHVAALDTELQDAADQAALAAATQLDGQANACIRAASAASSLLSNKTYLANDGSGTGVAVPTSGVTDCTGNSAIKFYQSYDQTTDTPGLVATGDPNARIVIVSVTPRRAVYALTPIVAVFRSGNIGAQAVASVSSAICKEPPVMICNPAETSSNTSFDPASYIGDGLRLTDVGSGSGTWAPGNFGYLNTNVSGISGTENQLRASLGWNTPPGQCEPSTGVNTKPGANTGPVTDAMNTRFDIYQNPNTSCYGTGTCSASINAVKDVRRPANANNTANGCALHSQGWQLDTSGSGYYGQSVPTTAADLPTTTTPSSMGHPRDECHAVSSSGTCASGRIGDGNWDRNAYFRTNYVRSAVGAGGGIGTYWTSTQWQNNTGLSPTAARSASNYASRYNVYAWEIAHRGQVIDGVTVLGARDPTSHGNTLVSYGSPQCSAAQGYGSGQIPDATTPDRRRISMAVVNCSASSVKGNSTGVPVLKWVDVFLVEPSVNRARTNTGDIYVEIIGETKNGSGAPAGSVIQHVVPYLIK